MPVHQESRCIAFPTGRKLLEQVTSVAKSSKGYCCSWSSWPSERNPVSPGVWPCRWEWGDNLHNHLLTHFVLIYRSLLYKLKAFLSADVSHTSSLLTTGPKRPYLVWFVDQYQHSEQSETAGNQTPYIPCCDQILPQKIKHLNTDY